MTIKEEAYLQVIAVLTGTDHASSSGIVHHRQ